MLRQPGPPGLARSLLGAQQQPGLGHRLLAQAVVQLSGWGHIGSLSSFTRLRMLSLCCPTRGKAVERQRPTLPASLPFGEATNKVTVRSQPAAKKGEERPGTGAA